MTNLNVDHFYSFEGFVARARRQAEERVRIGKWSPLEAQKFVDDAPKRWKDFGNEGRWDNGFQCKECQDQGAVIEPGIGLIPCPKNCAKARQDAKRRYDHWKGRVQHLGSAKYYQSLTFTSWDMMPDWAQHGKALPYAAARLYAQKPNQYVNLHDIYFNAGVDLEDGTPNLSRNWLVFYGDMGVGKTGLAASIMWELEARHIPVLMVRTYDLLEQLKSGYSRARRDDWEMTPHMMLRDVQDAPVLILDEWGTDRPASEWDKQQMEEITRHRHARYLPTVITTNMHPGNSPETSKFYKYWGGRAADVLMEASHVIEVSGARLREGAPIVTEEGVL